MGTNMNRNEYMGTFCLKNPHKNITMSIWEQCYKNYGHMGIIFIFLNIWDHFMNILC